MRNRVFYILMSTLLLSNLSHAKQNLHALEQLITPIKEAADIASVISSLETIMQKPHARGDVHGKSHACLAAKFKILSAEEFPAEVHRVGIFKNAGQEWQATLRFSSGSGEVQADQRPDARGIALKIHNVEGQKTLDSESLTATNDQESQVFTAIPYPAFIVKNPSDYTILTSEQVKRGDEGLGTISFLAGTENLGLSIPTRIPTPRLVESFNAAMILALGGSMGNPLQFFYHSMLPYANGAKQAFKYRFLPCDEKIVISPIKIGSSNYLADAVANQLTPKPGTRDTNEMAACFNFQVQLHRKGLPIEDATVVWNEFDDPIQKLFKYIKAGPFKTKAEDAYQFVRNHPRFLTTAKSNFVTVATIEIPSQTMDANDPVCHQSSFNPGFGLAANRVLGGIGRTRVPVYSRIFELRSQAH